MENREYSPFPILNKFKRPFLASVAALQLLFFTQTSVSASQETEPPLPAEKYGLSPQPGECVPEYFPSWNLKVKQYSCEDLRGERYSLTFYNPTKDGVLLRMDSNNANNTQITKSAASFVESVYSIQNDTVVILPGPPGIDIVISTLGPQPRAKSFRRNT